MSWFSASNLIKNTLAAVPAISSRVANRIHYQVLPQESQLPHIWFTRSSRETDDCLSEPGLLTERYILEICAITNEEALVDAVVSTLEALEGTVDGRSLQLVEVEDAGDEYLFRSLGDDDADFLFALNVTLYIL